MFEVGVRITFGLDEQKGTMDGGISSLEEKFQAAAKLGIYSCQLNMWSQSLFTDENAEIVKDISKRTGVKISGLWAGWSGPCEWNFNVGPEVLGLVPPAYRGQRTKELIMASEFAQKIGVTDIITHCGFLPENPNDPNFMGVVGALRKICGVMKERGQYFLFETGQETPITIVRTIEAVGTGNLGINLDTGNLILYGKANPVDALYTFGKYVRNTHIKDGFYPTEPMTLGRTVETGTGMVDFPKLIAKLKELNYQGPLTIESELSAAISNEEERFKNIITSKKLLDKIKAEQGIE